MSPSGIVLYKKDGVMDNTAGRNSFVIYRS